MIINNAILHILDFKSDITVFSQKELNIADEPVETYVSKCMEKALSDPGQKKGQFLNESLLKSKISEYLDDSLDFTELSATIANSMYEKIKISDKPDSMDLLVSDFSADDIRYLGICTLSHNTAYTHKVQKEGEAVKNNIIRHYAILPAATRKSDSFAFINLNNMSSGNTSVTFMEKKRVINGQDVFVLPDFILQCTSALSSKDVLKQVSDIISKVAEENGENTTRAISKAKSFIVDNSEMSDILNPFEMGEKIFTDSEQMKNDYVSEAEKFEIPHYVKVEKSFCCKNRAES